MTTTTTPDIDLGLTDEEDSFVKDVAWRIHRVSYLNALDNALNTARAIGIIREHSYGRGRRGSFNAALIARGFTSAPLAKGFHR
jgi:hypothetical protein